MQIYVNNKPAAIKQGSSFEFVAENRMFSGSDGYTLNITFPLAGCAENIAIFGHINRADVAAQKVIFECEIRDKGFYKFGSITITEISETEVKTQFLEGRSEQNFDKTFDKIYINELDLGDASDAAGRSPEEAWDPHLQGMRFVALPWVNDYSGNIQNLADYHEEERNADGTLKTAAGYEWNKDCHGRSWQPYLLYLTRKICEALPCGAYSCDLSELEKHEQYKYLLICNTLPTAWDDANFASALPHWTVAEYFEKLELFLGGFFTINHREKKVAFNFYDNLFTAAKTTVLEDVVDEHSTEVAVEEDKCEYLETRNLIYKDCDHEMWKFYSCDWFLKSQKNKVIRYATMQELLEANKVYATWNGFNDGRNCNRDKVFYAEDVNAYFIFRSLSKTIIDERESPRPNLYTYKMELRPLNLFGGRIVDDSEEADTNEVEFVPAWIDETEEKYGRLLFLNFSGYDDNGSTGTAWSKDMAQRKTEIDNTLFQPGAVQTLEAGEKEKKSEYYSVIYMAWWDGAMNSFGKLPHPYAENIEIAEDMSNYSNIHFSMRLNDSRTRLGRICHKIDTKKKSTFKFLADRIPNVLSVFNIRGKRYICEKITATFTENGMSQLLKGVFYPIAE